MSLWSDVILHFDRQLSKPDRPSWEHCVEEERQDGVSWDFGDVIKREFDDDTTDGETTDSDGETTEDSDVASTDGGSSDGETTEATDEETDDPAAAQKGTEGAAAKEQPAKDPLSRNLEALKKGLLAAKRKQKAMERQQRWRDKKTASGTGSAVTAKSVNAAAVHPRKRPRDYSVCSMFMFFERIGDALQ